MKDRNPQRSSLLVYARQFEDRVEAVLVYKLKPRRQWSDCMAHAVFAKPGWSEVTANPKLNQKEAAIYNEVATGIVWQALTILAHAGDEKTRKIKPALRRKYAKAGVRGWSWRQITIDLGRARVKQSTSAALTPARAGISGSVIGEGWLMAAAVMRQAPSVKPQGYFSAWPEYFHSFADQVEQTPKMRRPLPSPRMITEADEAMLWLRWLEIDDAKLLWLRAKRTPWKPICWQFGLSRQHANKRWQYGLAVIVWHLRGKEPPTRRSMEYVIGKAKAV